LTIPQKFLTPLIAVLAFIGVYSVVSNPFDLYMIIGLGVFGWLIRKLGFSLAPVILGVVLGNLFEDNLRRALSISGGDWMILIDSGRSIVIYILTALILFLPPLFSRIKAGIQKPAEAAAR
jgi:putative tricarboxylic transport membrane protein